MGQTLTRAALGKTLVDKIGLSTTDAEAMVQRTLGMIAQALGSGETVKLTGFGTLEVRARGARKGRNPKTGEAYPVEARRVVVFTPSAKLRERLDDLD